ncbi:alpha/beta hydrolase [Candidatus Binatia bacterium]|nr:alpha/beta hydrolase [Candidatus Binatia bacterium]
MWHGLAPAAFDPASIDDETRQVNDLIERTLAAFPSLHTRSDVAEIRREREEGRGPFPPLVLSSRATVREIPGRAGTVKLRIFAHPDPRGVYLHLHGGGWTLGAAHQQDPPLEMLADTCRVTVVSVEYRLAPEHPYPAGPDDCEDAALWLLANAKRELGSDRLLIGGESAGAHLSVVTLLRLRARNGATGFAGANLVYGCYDLGFTPSMARWGERNLILSTPIVEWFADHFVPRARRAEPDVSPIHADLRGMPPALFSVGTMDPLLDDTLYMHARWLAAGNASQLAVFPGGIHAFNAFPTALGRAANELQMSFLAATLG